MAKIEEKNFVNDDKKQVMLEIKQPAKKSKPLQDNKKVLCFQTITFGGIPAGGKTTSPRHNQVDLSNITTTTQPKVSQSAPTD